MVICWFGNTLWMRGNDVSRCNGRLFDIIFQHLCQSRIFHCCEVCLYSLVNCVVSNGPQTEERTNKDGNSGDALQPQIAATYIFVIAVPLYEIIGAALNVGVITELTGSNPSARDCPLSSTRIGLVQNLQQILMRHPPASGDTCNDKGELR